MEIITQKTKEDYENYVRYFCFQRRLTPKIFSIVVISLYASFLGTQVFPNTNYFINFIVVAIISSVIYFVIPFILSTRKLKKTFLNEKLFLEKLTISTTTDGVQLHSDTLNVLWKWVNIKLCENSKDFIYILLFDKTQSVLIPKRDFNSDEDAQAFFNTIQNEVLKAQGLAKATSGKHLYKWGWLGLIPNVGLVAGVILLFRGVFKFNDRKLILIGIGDILFTIVFWTTVIFFSENSTSFIQLHNEVTQKNLNSLVKYIEFYKIQHGVYPDSLQQLDKGEDEFMMIYESAKGITKGNKPRLFNYQKVGQRYRLSSDGTDEIPDTKDDIYPRLQNADTTKIGLIIK